MSQRLTGKEGIRAFLLKRMGKVVTTEEIYEASGRQGQYGRRLRELREDEGWPIESHLDASDLKPGQYRLSGPPPENPPKISRNVSARLRAQVFERNGFTCQMCGLSANDTDPETGRRVTLHIGHIVDRQHGGRDEMGNLRALCRRCNQGAKDIAQEPPTWTWLLSQIRRATVTDQEKAYEWLKRRLGRGK